MEPTKELLEALKSKLQIDFYKKLEKGNIEAARRTTRFIHSQFAQIAEKMDFFVEVFAERYPAEIKIISPNWATLKKLYNQLIQDIEKDLPRHLTDKEVKEDLKTYQELFKDIFWQVIQDMAVCIDAIAPQLLALVEKQKKSRIWPRAEYTKKYLSLKDNKNYRPYKQIINAREEAIQIYLSTTEKNKRKIKDPMPEGGPWEGYYHAWLTYPLDDYRIVYKWNPAAKTVTFLIIDKHKSLGLKGHT